MIDYNVIIAFFGAIISVFFGQALVTRWTEMSEEQKAVAATQVATFVDAVKQELVQTLTSKKKKEKIDMPDDFEGDASLVSAWCRRMTLYFFARDIENEFERIAIALGKIKKGKEDRAQRWADEAIKLMVAFQPEYKRWKLQILAKEGKEREPTEDEAKDFSNVPPFDSWKDMMEKMDHFFVTKETQADAIKKLKALRQGTHMIEDYWIEFNSWQTLTGYNEVALVRIFCDGLHPALGRKLVELGGLTESNTLLEWYRKAVEYERARRLANQNFA
ncbi:hypothetical protein NP233_g1446 [Leucocoprinus birnbaumii]|uniref:Retrotransposon gag domain-containing protein n=1 Tax=Leucocoprinus birnbaumii TaxID=56174 RepID=A0AAD5W0A8_9AGAR|nr:hypothetical protein NP233_g1446 [Leucocoprinus birnbaumii]